MESTVNSGFWESDSEKNVYLSELGEILSSQNCGGFNRSTNQIGHVFVHTVPRNPSISCIFPGLVVLDDSRLLRDLCELMENSSGREISWTCKRKGDSRLFASCSHFGSPPRCRGSGIRLKQSQKVNCTAFVKTKRITRKTCIPLNKILKQTSEQCDFPSHKLSFTVVVDVNMAHSGHEVHTQENLRTILKRSKEILDNDRIRACMLEFLGVSNMNRGRILAMQQFVSSRFPEYSIPYRSLKNAVSKLEVDDDDAQKLIDTMNEECEAGEIEYLSSSLDAESGVLKSVTWAFKGSKEIVQRCGDLAFWDSTHHVTRYNFKLSTFTAVDSEGKSRSVLMSLNLSETTIDVIYSLQCWKNAFGVPLPQVVVSDDDEAFRAALSSFPDSANIAHLTCIYHLFDINVKKHLRGLLGLSGGDAKWRKFRESLAICREATTEEELTNLWNQLFEIWLSGETEEYRRAREYLTKHVWSKRERWAVCYFKDKFTLGASTTQRSESWNALVKSCSKKANLTAFYQSIKFLFQRQGTEEQHSNSYRVRTSPITLSKVKFPKSVLEFIITEGVSKFFSRCLAEELSHAVMMSLRNPLKEISSGFTSTISRLYDENLDEQAPCSVFIYCTEEKNFDLRSECLYPVRMKQPCRHLLSLALSVDRNPNYFLSSFSMGRFDTMLELILSSSTGSRWKHINNQLESTACSSKERCSSPSDTPPQMFKNPEPRLTFPRTTDNGGWRRAYSIVLSEFKALASDCTQTSNSLILGELLWNLSTSLREGMLSTPKQVSPAEINEHFLGLLNSATQGLTVSCSPQTEQPQCSAFISKSVEECESSDNVPVVCTAKNPPKRNKRLKFPVSKFIGKTRSQREFKKLLSRRAPSCFRDLSKYNVRLPEKPKGVKYACSFCTDIKLQNNCRNVIVHVSTKHNISVEDAMRMKDAFIDAALTYNERKAHNIPTKGSSNLRSRKRKVKEIVDLTEMGNEDENSDLSVYNQLHKKSPNTNNPVSNHSAAEGALTNISLDRTIPNPRTVSNMSLNLRYHPKMADIERGSTVQILILPTLTLLNSIVTSVNRENLSFSADCCAEEEMIFEEKSTWRIITHPDPFPTLSVHIHPEFELPFMKTLNFSTNFSNKGKLVPQCNYEIYTDDFKTLDVGGLLTDEVITKFAQSMMENSRSLNDKRFYYISPQAIVKLEDRSIGITRWLNGVQLHDIDVLIWPIHSAAYVHWFLCIGFPSSKQAMIIDPYDPLCCSNTSKLAKTVSKSVLNGLSQLSRNYDATKQLKNKWKLVSSKQFAQKASIPSQPSGNGTDCGVLVCLYIWSLVTGQSMREFHISNLSYSQMITNARANIGGAIVAMK